MRNWTLAFKLRSMLEQHFHQVPQSIAIDIHNVLEAHEREDEARKGWEALTGSKNHPRTDAMLHLNNSLQPSKPGSFPFDEEPTF